MTAPAAPAPGFYPDPLDDSAERWWDGAGWTETVRSNEDSPIDAVADVGADTGAGTTDPAGADVPHLVPTVEPDTSKAPAVVPPVPVPVPVPVLVPVPSVPVAPARLPEPAIAAGFYPDPYGQAPLRWWDGRQWTVRTGLPEGRDTAAKPAPGTAPTAGHVAPVDWTAWDPDSVADETAAAAGAATEATRPRTASTSVLPPRTPGSDGGIARVRHLLAALPGRVGLRGLAAVLVLAIGLATRLYLVVDARSDGTAAASRIATTVNLRADDLPRGWVPVVVDDSTAGQPTPPPAPAGAADPAATFDRVVARCSGASDHAQVLSYSAASPGWTRGTTAVSSQVSIVHSAADARRDLSAQQGPRVGTCISKDGLEPLRQMLAAQGVHVSAVTVQRLPAAADGFALRMRMTATRGGRPLTLFTDSYGFVRGPVEVGLTMVSAGVAPDRSAATSALAKLRLRAERAVPLN